MMKKIIIKEEGKENSIEEEKKMGRRTQKLLPQEPLVQMEKGFDCFLLRFDFKRAPDTKMKPFFILLLPLEVFSVQLFE